MYLGGLFVCSVVCFAGDAGTQRMKYGKFRITKHRKEVSEEQNRDPGGVARTAGAHRAGCGVGHRGSRAGTQNEKVHPSALSGPVSKDRDTEMYSPTFSFVWSSRITESKEVSE